MNKLYIALIPILITSCGGQTSSRHETDSVSIETIPQSSNTSQDTSSVNISKNFSQENVSQPSINSWNEVVSKLDKSYKVIGIYTMTQGGHEFPLIIYKKNSKYYINHCEMSEKPFEHENSDLLKKISSKTFMHNEPGSDMPEKYIINNGELDSYAYNPDVSEWVEMGTYWQVY